MVMRGLLRYKFNNKKKKGTDRFDETLKRLPGTLREFSLSDLEEATNNFDETFKRGDGQFEIYKGVLPSENVQVFIKKFDISEYFLDELTIINRLRHRHLVPLLGWCHENETLLLVYDYLPNGSLFNHLFNDQNGQTLSWEHRYKIISGVASALNYLHNDYIQSVVHRDIKPSNIYLDSNYNAYLGGFGFARALEHEDTSYDALEGLVGTRGYLSPECIRIGNNTRESDIYAFGVVVLEVVCGRRVQVWDTVKGMRWLMDYVRTLYKEGRILEAVDKMLEDSYTVEEAERLLLLGLACSHPIETERPKTQSILQIASGSVPASYTPPLESTFMGSWTATDSSPDLISPYNSSPDDIYNKMPITSSYNDYGASGSGSGPERGPVLESRSISGPPGSGFGRRCTPKTAKLLRPIL